jgi:hypothetical protein
MIDEQLRRSNMKRRSFDYNVGDKVLLLAPNPDKMKAKATGPFLITRVHANGTVTIRRSLQVVERINIRRIKPYRS